MGGCLSTMPRRPKSSGLRPSPQVQLPDSVEIQRYEYPSSVYSYPPSPYDGGGLVTDAKKRLERRYSVCTICYDNPMDIALGCKHRICSTCERKVYHCPHCQTPILTKLKLICGDEKFWCHICLTYPKSMAFACGHQTCSECGRDLQSCAECGSVGTPMQLY